MLGITTFDRSQHDSAMRTSERDGSGAVAADWQRLEDLESQKPDPRIWTTVERTDGQDSSPDVTEMDLKPGMKKTVWNVRR